MSDVARELLHLSGWPVYLVVAALVFGETAILLGVVLPGETAALLGGVLVARGQAAPVVMVVVVWLAAVAGDSVGFAIGTRIRRRAGRHLERRRIRRAVDRAHRLMRSYGGVAVLAGRFLPLVRTAMPDAAAVARLPYLRYLVFDVVTDLVWSVACVLVGFLLAGLAVRLGGALGPVLLVVALAVAVALWLRRHRRRTHDPDHAADVDHAPEVDHANDHDHADRADGPDHADGPHPV